MSQFTKNSSLRDQISGVATARSIEAAKVKLKKAKVRWRNAVAKYERQVERVKRADDCYAKLSQEITSRLEGQPEAAFPETPLYDLQSRLYDQRVKLEYRQRRAAELKENVRYDQLAVRTRRRQLSSLRQATDDVKPDSTTLC